MTADLTRWALAGVLALLWLALSAWWLRPRRRAAVTGDATLILHASQTGQALELAQRTAKRLAEGGQNVVLMPLGHAAPAQLAGCEQLLLIVATTGVGEPPDEARSFVACMADRPDLSATRYAMLALGDHKYEDFCAFGRRVDGWLEAAGAKLLHPRIEADDLAPEALAQWDRLLDALGAVETKAESPYRPWRVAAREHLNPAPGDATVPALWRIALEPEAGALPDWQAGDLFEIMTPGGHRRDYSVASLPEEGGVTLLVRAVQGQDGTPGEGSGLLIGAEGVSARLRDHAPFHRAAGDGPLLLIAAGSGFAGIRPHALDAMRAGRPVWIILGERWPDIDARTVAEARGWEADGRLHRLDLAFSRLPDGEGRYVQHALHAAGDAIAAWLGEGGAVMLCGGLAMGKAVEATLDAALGPDWRAAARAAGRYHADLY